MTVDIIIEDKILIIQMSGAYVMDSIINLFEEIEKTGGYAETSGILLDFDRLNDGISVFESYAFIKRLCRMAGDKKKIAMFRKNGMTDGEMVCEAIGENMGTKIKSFNSKIEAVKWIKSKN